MTLVIPVTQTFSERKLFMTFSRGERERGGGSVQYNIWAGEGGGGRGQVLR